MQGRYNGYVWPEITVVSNGNFSIVLYGEMKIAKKVFADFCMLPIVKRNRLLQEAAFSKVFQQFLHNCAAFFPFFLQCMVVCLAELVRFSLYRAKRRIARIKQNVRFDSIFFPHLASDLPAVFRLLH